MKAPKKTTNRPAPLSMPPVITRSDGLCIVTDTSIELYPAPTDRTTRPRLVVASLARTGVWYAANWPAMPMRMDDYGTLVAVRS